MPRTTMAQHAAEFTRHVHNLRTKTQDASALQAYAVSTATKAQVVQTPPLDQCRFFSDFNSNLRIVNLRVQTEVAKAVLTHGKAHVRNIPCARCGGLAYYRLYSDDMPVYITADSILHAWHRSFDDHWPMSTRSKRCSNFKPRSSMDAAFAVLGNDEAADLLLKRMSSSKWTAVVVDAHTDTPSVEYGDPGSILHWDVNFGLFTVDGVTYAGPVFSNYEFVTPINKRLNDDEFAKKLSEVLSPSWATDSYMCDDGGVYDTVATLVRNLFDWFKPITNAVVGK
ncbi:TPA: hypothetical protein N0F65_006951 [Lagenidium giganteum]|uniref:Uncharacterized protein n=1 Tax=Lagenidium giganteum TaxID=4803 RepID=A0AAV2ZK96_9STRA|nr:TPA: hypothetical protein N0F65_006951 [Lagenidium giganteum]